MKKTIKIIGGGLAGLIAAHYFKDSVVFEAGPRLAGHRALLRFRENVVSKITGVPFEQVKVDKGVWYQGSFYQEKCPLPVANAYSMKVTGGITGRSIANLESVQRYVAPDDLYDRLVDNLEREGRIFFNSPINLADKSWPQPDSTWINTAPLPVILKQLGINREDIGFNFDHANIQVERYKIKIPCKVYQTVYFAGHDDRYRASITGNVLISETIGTEYDGKTPDRQRMQMALNSFGIECSWNDIERMIDINSYELVPQKYGKIVNLPDEKRKAILYHLTEKYGIFSLGRFATWRNVLLDDVAHDLVRVDSLINASQYDTFKSLRS